MCREFQQASLPKKGEVTVSSWETFTDSDRQREQGICLSCGEVSQWAGEQPA